MASIWRPSSRAIARVTSFSRVPLGPTAPGSWPPCPASMAMTSGRMTAAGCTGAGFGAVCCTTGGCAVTGAGCRTGTGCGCTVATEAGGGICAGAALEPLPPAICEISRSVAALDARVGSAAAGGVAGAWSCLDTSAISAAIGSPPPPASSGHSTTSRAPPAEGSMRGRIATTAVARSKTMRVTPGSGWPLRTAFTRPAGAGSLNPLARRLPGKSITSRSGLASEITLNSACPPSASSARVPVGPLSRRRSLISAALATFQTRPASRARPSRNSWIRAPRMRMVQVNHQGKCNASVFSL